MTLTNDPNFDKFVDDEYQSKQFIQKAERDRRQKPILTIGKAISEDKNVHPLFKNLFK